MAHSYYVSLFYNERHVIGLWFQSGQGMNTLIQSQTTFYSSENWSLETVTVKCAVIFVILYRHWMVYILFLLMVIMKFGVLMVCPLSVLFVQRYCSRTDQTYAGPRVRKPPVQPAAPAAGENEQTYKYLFFLT